MEVDKLKTVKSVVCCLLTEETLWQPLLPTCSINNNKNFSYV